MDSRHEELYFLGPMRPHRTFGERDLFEKEGYSAFARKTFFYYV